MKLKNILLIITLFLPLSLYSQNDKAQIVGRIFAKNSKQPVEAALVNFPSINRSVITDGNGRFSIQGLPLGNIELTVNHLSYKPVAKEISLLPGENNITLSLEENIYVADEILVSAGFFTTRDETAYKIESFGAQELAQSGTHNMMEALTKVPGVSQISYGPGIGKPVIRGLSFSRIMTVYQGVRFENQQWGEDHGLGLNDVGVERIEIIKGPASLIYGSGAIGGVIHIVDERPASPGINGYFGTRFFSNTLGGRTDFGLKGANTEGFFWNAGGNFQSHADYMDGNNRIVGNSRFHNGMFKATAGVEKAWGSTKFTYTYNKQILGIIEEDEMVETLATTRWDRSLQHPYQDVTDHLFVSQSVFNIGNNRLRVNLGHHLNLREENEEEGEIDLGLVLNTSSYDIKYNFFPNSNLEFITGIQGFVQRNRNMEDAHEILLPDANQWDNGIYGLMMFSKGPLNLQGGLRYDRRITHADARGLGDYVLPGDPESRTLTRAFAGFTGSLGATYKLKENFILRSNLASGFRAPDLAELFSNGEHPGTNRFERGNAGFEREQNVEYDLSAMLRQRNFSFEAAGYVNYIQNYIFFSPTDQNIGELWVWEFEQDNVQLHGGEAGLVWHPENASWFENKLTYSLVRGIRLGTGNDLPLIPADRISNEIRFKREKFGKFNSPYASIWVQHVFPQNRIGEFELQTSDYTLVSAGLGGITKVGKNTLNLDLNVNNLFNVAYFDHLAVTRPFGIRNLGRNVTVSAKLNF